MKQEQDYYITIEKILLNGPKKMNNIENHKQKRTETHKLT